MNARAAEWEDLMRECLIEGGRTAAAEVISCDALILGGVKPWLLACVCFGYGQTEAIHGIMGRIREGQRAGKGKTRKLRRTGVEEDLLSVVYHYRPSPKHHNGPDRDYIHKI